MDACCSLAAPPTNPQAIYIYSHAHAYFLIDDHDPHHKSKPCTTMYYCND